MKTRKEILTQRAMISLFKPGTLVSNLDKAEQKMLGEKIAELDAELGSDPEVAVYVVRRFVRAAYDEEVNPLPIIRKVYPHLKWSYIADVTFRQEEPGTPETRIAVASEEYRVASGECYVVCDWK